MKKYPFYIKSTVVMLGLVLLFFILFVLREIVVPVAFALMIAILLNPLVNKFQAWKIPKVVAISLALAAAILLVAGISYFLSSQVAGFADEAPKFKQKALEHFQHLQQWAKETLNISSEKQTQLLNEAGNNMKPYIGKMLGTVAGSLATIFLLPVYTFLFLYYKLLIQNFLYEVFADENSKEVATVLSQTKGAIQNYMTGLLLEALVVAVLNSVALLLLGVKYAILLGTIGAILNMLPYVGGIIAIALPVMIATVTGDGFNTQLGIFIAYMVIQFVDNNFLVPYIVSSKVKINALMSVIIVLLGGALWGISGMFLSIPFIGVLKIIFDRIPELQPWGKLLGEDIPVINKRRFSGKGTAKKEGKAGENVNR